MRKKGVLLVNLGTPDSPSVNDVRKYLREFLTDPRVIDINAVSRHLLVNGFIVPFRAPKSADAYSKIWSAEKGSPLLYYSIVQKQLLTEQLSGDYVVELAMRYQNPSIQSALERLRNQNVSQIIVIPLFPQYASATTESIIEKVEEITDTWAVVPPVKFVHDFHDNELMIAAFANKGSKYLADGYDHVLFSFHGLPKRQLIKCDPSGQCLNREDCCKTFSDTNQFCYSAQAYHTAHLIAERLGLSQEDFTVCFQSRLGKSAWMQPYTSELIRKLATGGKKKVLVFCPSFVSDCLETIYEIGDEYKHEFIAASGERLQLVEGLNDDPLFILALKELVLHHTDAGLKLPDLSAGHAE